MIKSKEDLKFYIEQDIKMSGLNITKPRFFRDEILRFQILLRKCEYINNCKYGKIWSIYLNFLKLRLNKKGMKLGFSVPLNVFGPGLSIAHYGLITINSNAKVGKNCRIHEGVTIGATDGISKAATIGDNVFIGSGAKVIGDVKIGNGISIGANSVVTKSFEEDNITIAGVPARKISNNGSYKFLKDLI